MHMHKCMHRVLLLCISTVTTCTAADKLMVDIKKRHAINPFSDHLTTLLVMNSAEAV